ncbi:zinc finger protein 808-like isoform X2 [Chironomus tepperi]|uniref:zinc finger protein 808-like isoform X2 n=1 Tax=Chironomus tepperi TaxID=113505 RepID=UPI00391EE7EE
MLTLDTDNSCRICMAENTKLESIFDQHNDRQISEIIMEISGIKIEETDSLSKKICEDCRTKVIDFSAFRQLCIDTDDTVRYNILLAEQTESLVEVDDHVIEENINQYEEECFIEENIDISQDGNTEYMETLVNDDEESSDKITEAIILEESSQDINNELTQKMREAHYAKEQLKKHKCPFCTKSFLFPSKVTRHVAAVHKNLNEPKKNIKKNHTCPICGKAFVSQFKVRRHMVVHDTELKTGLQKNWSRNYFLCETCNRKFHTQTTFDRHILICDLLLRSTLGRPENYQFICVICSELFFDHDEMADHMKNLHDQHADHTCQLCSFTGSLQEIIKHGRYHEENVTYHCCICEKTFPNGDEIIMHLLRHAEYKPFECSQPGCNKTFFDKYKLKQHIQTHDPNAKKNFICEFCQRSFAQLDYLNCHIRRKHSSVKPYSCSYCPKQFAFLHDLNLHSANHTGNKKHICQICDTSFTKAWSLKQHMSLHEVSATPHKCKKCDFTALSKSEVNNHYVVHLQTESQVSYLCGECDVECRTEDDLKNHLEEAHSQFSFIDSNNSDYNLEIP